MQSLIASERIRGARTCVCLMVIVVVCSRRKLIKGVPHKLALRIVDRLLETTVVWRLLRNQVLVGENSISDLLLLLTILDPV